MDLLYVISFRPALAVRHFGRGVAVATVLVDLPLDAEIEEDLLHLPQKRQARRVERHVGVLTLDKADRPISREQTAKERRGALPVEAERCIEETLLGCAFVEHGIAINDDGDFLRGGGHAHTGVGPGEPVDLLVRLHGVQKFDALLEDVRFAMTECEEHLTLIAGLASIP